MVRKIIFLDYKDFFMIQIKKQREFKGFKKTAINEIFEETDLNKEFVYKKATFNYKKIVLCSKKCVMIRKK